jgi:hypothetical protein
MVLGRIGRRLSDIDAADFLRGIDNELMTHDERGLYNAPRSYAREQFFWSGLRSKNPRPVYLWTEPIITVAVLARLVFDLDWPIELLGTQTKKVRGFDVATYWPENPHAECIVCEVKKSTAELNQLIDLMKEFGMDPDADKIALKEQNAHRKVKALRLSRPPFFWAVGPGGTEYAFKMRYLEDNVISFQKIAKQELRYLPKK